MDLIRQRLEESRVRYTDACKTASNDGSRISRSQTKLTDRSEKAVPKIGDNITPHTYGMPESPETKLRSRIQQNKVEMVPLSNTKSSETSKGSFPYVYFVVSVDRQNQSNSIQESVDESQPKDSRKYRSALLSRMQKRYIKEDDRARMQHIAGEVGLKSDAVPPPSRSSVSQRTISFPMSQPSTSPPRNPPATPATIGSACHFLDNDNLSMDLKGGKMSSIDLADISIIGTSRPSTKQMSTRVLELPFMSVDIQRKNLGTASASTIESKSMELVSKSSFTSSQESENRRVHFSETIDLPMIKGSRIVITPTIPTQISPRPSTMPALIGKKEAEFKENFKQAYERQKNFQHQTPGTPRPRKIGTPLTLPKIDIVSGVYDELVIKAIESYVREFPPASKQGQVARQLLRQLQERSISAADLTQMDDHRMRGHKKLSIKELPDDGSKSRKPEYKTEKTNGGATRRGHKSKDRLYSTIAPTCFKMANPGGLEETTSSSGSSKQNRKSAERGQVNEQ